MKQFFKINEISKLYNIGPDSLRYYEKLRLLAPKRGKNNYRLYTLDDLWRLNIIRDLRRLGFPMEKIREYMDNRSVENTRKLLTEELDVIHKQIQELNRLQKNVEERLLTLSGAEDQALLKIRLLTFPDRFCHTLDIPYHTAEEMDLLVKQLLNKNTENLYIEGDNLEGVIPSTSTDLVSAFIFSAKGKYQVSLHVKRENLAIQNFPNSERTKTLPLTVIVE